MDEQVGPYPYPKWRKRAEDGYLYALGLKKLPAWSDQVRADAHVHSCIVYAILALLDGQDGYKEKRLFRGWFFDLSRSHDRNLSGNGTGRVGQPHDRLIRDITSDVRFLMEATEVESGRSFEFAATCFVILYKGIERGGGDARPLWRRAGKSWPVVGGQDG